jgi:hypothetical protein
LIEQRVQSDPDFASLRDQASLSKPGAIPASSIAELDLRQELKRASSLTGVELEVTWVTVIRFVADGLAKVRYLPASICVIRVM